MAQQAGGVRVLNVPGAGWMRMLVPRQVDGAMEVSAPQTRHSDGEFGTDCSGRRLRLGEQNHRMVECFKGGTSVVWSTYIYISSIWCGSDIECILAEDR
uniref:(Liberia) tandem repeat n=1 Tax=Schistosoma mansoni TaxID=6183 RepID=Q26608_SCHMA|nr:unnamed protein product [Schistosoma mansoni]